MFFFKIQKNMGLEEIINKIKKVIKKIIKNFAKKIKNNIFKTLIIKLLTKNISHIKEKLLHNKIKLLK